MHETTKRQKTEQNIFPQQNLFQNLFERPYFHNLSYFCFILSALRFGVKNK
jgi:hypothetical protein